MKGTIAFQIKLKGIKKMKKTELQKIRERAARRAWWKHNKQDILDFCSLLAFGCVGWWFYCLICYVYADVF